MPTGIYPRTTEHKRRIGLGVRKAFKSTEIRKKMSLSHLGIKMSAESSEKKRKALMGNKNGLGYRHSEEMKRKMSQLKFNQSEETRRKIGLAHSGEKSEFWRGGISLVNRTLRANINDTFEYKNWRSLIFSKDDFVCQYCGERGGKLHAHHIEPFRWIIDRYKIDNIGDARLSQPLWDLGNGITLCNECHREIHSKSMLQCQH